MVDLHKDKEKLQELYISENLTQKEIGEKLGVHKNTISYWINKHNISKDKSAYNQDSPPVSEEKLRNLYWGEKLSQSKIADRLGYKQATIGNYLREYGIETRGPGGVQEPNFDREEFERLYIDEGLGIKSVSEELGVGRNTLIRWRNQWDIKAHNTGNKKREKVDDAKIVRLYVKEGLSQAEIAEEIDVDVNQTTISSWLDDLKTNTRNKAGWGQLIETDRGEVVKSALEKRVADWFYEKNIDYEYEPNIDGTRYVPDFQVGDRLVEVWGIRQLDQYDRRREEKINTYESLGFEVISVYPIIGDRPSFDDVLPKVAWENSQTTKN